MPLSGPRLAFGVTASVAPIGVLLAAGRGRRFGGGKSLRPWPGPAVDDPPMVLAARRVLDPCVSRLLVVVGDRADEVMRAVTVTGDGGPPRIERVDVDPDAPMLASIIAGLRVAATLDAAAPVLVHLADVPGTRPETVHAVCRAATEPSAAGRAIMPEHEGRGGHPVWIPPAVAAAVAALDPEHPGGLRAWWTEHPQLTRRVAVPDADCRRDIDTRADLVAGQRAAGTTDPEQSGEPRWTI